MAFFPCTRFEDQIVMGFRGCLYQLKNWSDEQKLEYDIKLHEELHFLYDILCKFAIVCIRKNIPLIIENPKGTLHYLDRYWCMKPSVIDKDRTERGDYFKKSTQYWFINRKPSNNLIFGEYADGNRVGIVERVKGSDRKVKRSLISPDYANRFIREFII